MRFRDGSTKFPLIFLVGLAVSLNFSENARSDCPEPLTSETGFNSRTSIVATHTAVKALACLRQNICEGTSLTWGRERIDADLALKELDPRGEPTVVGFLDSGLAASADGWFNRPVQYKKSFNESVITQADPRGHGTAVALVVGDKDIGVAPSAQVVFYSKAPADGSLHPVYLRAALEALCQPGGPEIINVSQGVADDEHGQLRDEVGLKRALAACAQNGILIVKGAGNDGVKHGFSTDDPDDAYLRVGASGPAGDSAFSNGEITAPGVDIFTRMAGDAGKLRDPLKTPIQCAAEKEAWGVTPNDLLISGTSFSTPMVSGIAANVIQVLKQNPSYRNLPGPEKIKLLNRILQASVRDANVNALRAVLIAKNFKKNTLAGIPAVDELRARLERTAVPLCRQSTAKCANVELDRQGHCDAYNACTAQLRKQWSLCPSRSPELVAQLVSQSLLERDVSSAKYYMSGLRGQSLDQIKPTTARDEISASFSKYYADVPAQAISGVDTLRTNLGLRTAEGDFSAARTLTDVVNQNRVVAGTSLDGFSFWAYSRTRKEEDIEFAKAYWLTARQKLETLDPAKAEAVYREYILDFNFPPAPTAAGYQSQELVLQSFLDDPRFTDVKDLVSHAIETLSRPNP